ncbi:MAG: SLC13 family permease [Desulfovibrionaceae bacterium]|nr:SLC13 family permease [Desulfovibrionaceae bacterium]
MDKQESGKFSIVRAVHIVVGVVIMFSGHFLPAFSRVVEPSEKLLAMGFPQVDGGLLISVTHMGMVVTMIFLGVIYLWTFVDTWWPGFLGLAALIFGNVAPAGKVLGMFFGNPMVGMMLILFIFAASIIYSGLAKWIASYLMRRRFIQGRPWVFTATIMVTTYIVAFFDQTTSVFLMWPVLFSLFEQAGFKRGDKYVSVMVVYVCLMALMSFASDPVKGGAWLLLTNLQSLAAAPGGNFQPLDTVSYFLFSQIISLTNICVLILLLRFVVRADASPLARLDLEKINREPLPPMNFTQKTVLITFIGYALWLMLPSILGPESEIGRYIHKNMMAGAILAVLAISGITFRGRPAVDVAVSNANYPWKVFFLIAIAMLLGGLMTEPSTNVRLIMEYALRDMLNGLSFSMLIVGLSVIGIVLTNFCNSVVLGLILTPVILAIAAAFGYVPGPMMACFIYCVLIAACTPAASPFAALLYGQTKWIAVKDIAKYSVMASTAVLLVVICIGMPLAKILFR